MSSALERYADLLDALLWKRVVEGPLGEDLEETFALQLNDTRRQMSPQEEGQIPEILARRRSIIAKPSLDLVDTEPPPTDDLPLRKAA